MTALDPQHVAEVVRRHILTEYRPDSCIASARAVIDVCGYFGIKAKPQPVRLMVWNRLGAELAAAKLPVDQWPAAAWSVGIEATGDYGNGRWDGHLVAVTGTHLIDASLDQASRPDKGITVGPRAELLPAGWPQRIVRAAPRGAVVAWEPVEDEHYRDSPNWKPSAVRARVCGAAIRELRAEAAA